MQRFNAKAVRFPLRKASPGQILPLGLVFLAACAAVMIFMFNSGKLVDEKLNVTHAADAAAYSAGLMQARALNYEAYVNRAIVANELAVGQALSMMSWIQYYQQGYWNVGQIDEQLGNWLFYPKDALKAGSVALALSVTLIVDIYLEGAIEEVVQYVQDAVGVTISAHAGVVAGLRATQIATDLAMSSGQSQKDVAELVAKQTDPALEVEVIPTSLVETYQFTKTYGRNSSDGDARGRLSEVVMASRDPFTKERNWTANGPTGAGPQGLQRDVAMKKRGGTDLVSFDEWVAIDTLEMHGRRFGCGFFGWCRDARTPLAWGGATVKANDESGKLGYHGNAPSENGRTTQYAQSAMTNANNYYGYWPGLSDTQDLSKLGVDDKREVGISFFVSKPIGTSKTVRNSNGNDNGTGLTASGQFALFERNAPGGRIAAISRAEVYFARPEARADGRTELASLYNPYWHARLVAATAIDRAYSATRQDNLILP